jgi:DNA-directed RNA polymerase specialized sigma24 family protein
MGDFGNGPERCVYWQIGIIMMEELKSSAKQEPIGKRIASRQQIMAAIEELETPENSKKRIHLDLRAQKLMYWALDDAPDLYQEIIKRLLAEKIKWYLDVNKELYHFIYYRMQSLAWELKQNGETQINLHSQTSEQGVFVATAEGTVEYGFVQAEKNIALIIHPRIEEEIHAQRKKEIARKLLLLELANSPTSKKVLMGILENLSPEEIQQAFGLTPREYESARRQILRKIDKIKAENIISLYAK